MDYADLGLQAHRTPFHVASLPARPPSPLPHGPCTPLAFQVDPSSVSCRAGTLHRAVLHICGLLCFLGDEMSGSVPLFCSGCRTLDHHLFDLTLDSCLTLNSSLKEESGRSAGRWRPNLPGEPPTRVFLVRKSALCLRLGLRCLRMLICYNVPGRISVSKSLLTA